MSNRIFVMITANETAHASAKKIVYGVAIRATHGLLLCLLISMKKKVSPAKHNKVHTDRSLPLEQSSVDRAAADLQSPMTRTKCPR
jgi:hypothetical protein